SPSRSPEIRPHIINLLVNSIAENLSLNVCSIGGGPGSDIVGLQMMLRNMGLSSLCHIRGYVLDQFPEWSNMWEKISSQMNQPPRVNFFKYDVGNNTPNVCHRYAVKQARLITLVKFISAVRKQQGAFEGMRSLLRHASPGAYMFYADNKDGGDNVSFLLGIAIMAGFELVHYSHSEVFIENNPLYSAIMKLLNHQPKRSVRMTYMLFRKKMSAN
ncbi:uncharacterized protein LOC117119074, partial [Anneissia japonica]|uniref:uncharacterized protein LOC117119074 n=1 Tax=Anneissia japonica TaxID=1529436 RepID=UPI0014259046